MDLVHIQLCYTHGLQCHVNQLLKLEYFAVPSLLATPTPGSTTSPPPAGSESATSPPAAGSESDATGK